MDSLINSIISIINQSGAFGVFLGVFAESIFPPIPSEAILGYAGFLVGSGKQAFIWMLIASILGKLASSAPIWWLGKKYGKGFVHNYGKYIGFDNKDYSKAEKVFVKHGYAAVLVSQFIPLVRSLISIPAGSLGVKFWPFMLCTAIGAGIWNTLLIYIGTLLGENWATLEEMLNPVLKPLKYLVIFATVGFVIYQAQKVYRIWKADQKKN
jgi:membrane protein DedA with SNARE-associated domain